MSDPAPAARPDAAPDVAPVPRAGTRGTTSQRAPRSSPSRTTALGLLALPSATLAWGAKSYSSASERELLGPDQPGPGERRSTDAGLGLRARLDRPLAEQGHDRARLLQPRHPGWRQGLRRHDRTRLLLPDRRREHRLERLPGRRGDGQDPADVHGLVGSPLQHPGDGLGPHRDRRLQGGRRQEDVDGPVRRPLRRHGREAEAQAEAGGPAEAAARLGHACHAAPDRATDRRHPRSGRPRPRLPRPSRPTPRHPATRAARVRRPIGCPSRTAAARPGSRSPDPGLRVVDPPVPGGLLETVVDGVAGLLFGG